MKARCVYDKVLLAAPLEERWFYSYLNDSVAEIRAMYAHVPHLVAAGEAFTLSHLDDEVPLYDEYIPSVVDNILYLAGKGDNRKGEFIRKAENAFLLYWNKNAKGRRLAMWD